MKRYRVTLTVEERTELEALTRKDRIGARKFAHARALLLCDASPGQSPWPTARIAEALGVSPRTVEHVKRRFVEEGLESALNRKVRETPPRESIVDGDKEARLIAMACSAPPAGHKRWTVRLLAERLVALEVFEAISPATVHRTLKKTNSSLT